MIRETLAATPLARSKRFARSLEVEPHPGLVRLGSAYGGWTIPDGFLTSESVCYSGGVGTDASFDLALIERYGCAVEAFDPTPMSVEYVAEANMPASFRFHPVALCGHDGEREFHHWNPRDGSFSVNLGKGGETFRAECRSVSSLMRELGHERLDLLKLDIEGAEYEVIDSLLADGVSISILCVEFHRTPLIRQMVRSAKRLREAGFAPVEIAYFDATFVSRELIP